MRQQVTLTARALGGYDDNLAVGLGAAGDVSQSAMASGYAEYLDATLAYFRGNKTRSIRTDATGNVRAYPGYTDGATPGGGVSFDGRTDVGRNVTLGAFEHASYEPLFTFMSGSAGSIPLPPALAASGTAAGLFERRSANSYSLLSIERRWGRRDSTSLSYSYATQQFTGDDYGDNQSHGLLMEYRRRLTGDVRIGAAYRYAHGDYTASLGAKLPTREHRIEAGPEIEKALSRRRHLKMSLAAGASSIEATGGVNREPYHSWVPTGSASLAVTLAPSWSVDAGYRRDFALLQGVTDEVYATDTAYLTTGGLVAPRTELRFGGTYGKWRTPLASGVNDTLDVYGATVQARVALTDKVGVTAGYFYYIHRYSNVAVLPAGFPAQYDRHAVRVGITMLVPLTSASLR